VAAIRKLSASDLPALFDLSASAAWNQTELDWSRLLTLEPNGCFGIGENGVLAATATVIRYRPNLAWLGMVLTLPEFRGRGLARKLVCHAIEYAGGNIIRLDASPMGKALYESLGFLEECTVERWLRDPAPISTGAAHNFEYDKSLDTAAFGADRSTLISHLVKLDAAAFEDKAFALGRPGRTAAYFGPCVSESQSAARSLLHWFIASHANESIFWDLFPHHTKAVELAHEFGFRPVRQLTRMSLHAPRPSLPDARIYAIAGFEYG